MDFPLTSNHQQGVQTHPVSVTHKIPTQRVLGSMADNLQSTYVGVDEYRKKRCWGDRDRPSSLQPGVFQICTVEI
jgi:hypothetical protein